MKNLPQIIFAMNRDMAILKKVIRLQSNLIDYLMKIVCIRCKTLHEDNINKLVAEIKKVSNK